MDATNQPKLPNPKAEADSCGDILLAKGAEEKNSSEQSHYVYENQALYDKMTGEKQVSYPNVRTYWNDVTALCTEFTLFARYFELMCGHFAMTLHHCSAPIRVIWRAYFPLPHSCVRGNRLSGQFRVAS